MPVGAFVERDAFKRRFSTRKHHGMVWVVESTPIRSLVRRCRGCSHN
ncbi:hypothetical protein ALO45_200246 [Pseudomonas syringae pv. syringae]|nr:hypothetical protein ALO45_200246 [Pseudomonas syringae pv. syringae]